MNAKTREFIYYGGALLTAAVGIAVTAGALSADQGANIGQALTGLLALLGAGAPALAARKTGEQRKDGTFEQLPSPVDQIINSVPAVVDAATGALDDLARVRDAAEQLGGIVRGLPGIGGPLTEQLINLARSADGATPPR